MAKYENICPAHNEIDVYEYCSFGCIYCITNAKCNHNKIKPFNLKAAIADISNSKKPYHPFYLSPWTDCYHEEEVDKKYTRSILKELSKRNLPFFVITKSTLVLRDLEFFVNRENAFIAISLNTLDDRIVKNLEPGAPSATERKALIEKLVSIPGLKIVVKIDPILPGITDHVRLEHLIGWLKKIKPTAITVETVRLTKDLAIRLETAVTGNEYKKLMYHYNDLNEIPQHPNLDYRLKLFTALAKEFAAGGIRAAFCRATLPYAITPYDCRGGYSG